jgi:small subunit ribosomal protein S6
MAFYESVFIARQDVSAQQVEDMRAAFANIITERGGTVGRTEYWGVRSLTYRIKKNRKGHYVLMDLDAASDAIVEMERNMRINEDVLRFMTVRVEKPEEGPSAMMQSRSREREGGRFGEREGRFGDRDRERFDRGPRRDRDEPRAEEGAV